MQQLTSQSTETLTEICFKDTVFLQNFGLSQFNVLDYFALSQFYDSSCINEQLKMQARFNQLQQGQLDPTQLKGLEYELWYFTLQPSLFVIKRQQRVSPSKGKFYNKFTKSCAKHNLL
jgi:mediator of RNA polymerase II transcription subunit 6